MKNEDTPSALSTGPGGQLRRIPTPYDIMAMKAEALRQQGSTAEARLLVDTILSQHPDHPDALLLAGIMDAQANPEAALQHLESLISIRPDSTEGLFWLGVARYKTGRHEDALRSLQRLVLLSPQSHYAHRYMGRALEALNRPEEALAHYEEALAITPGNGETFTLMGVLYARYGRLHEAVQAFENALAANPDDDAVHVCLARVLVDLNRDEEAYGHYREALRLKPSDADTMVYLAILLLKTSNIDDAQRLLQQAERIDPEHLGVLNTLGRVKNAQGKGSEAVEWFRRGFELDPSRKDIASNLLFSLNYLPDATPEEVAEQHARVCGQLYPPQSIKGCYTSPFRRTSGPLKIGYVSADFHTHSVTSFFEPILQHHDRTRFLPILYYGKGVEDDTTVRMREMAFLWRSTVGLSAEEVAEMVRTDGIDILVDLSGHSGLNRLDIFALKPAPVQVSWIGYPHSSGMRQMDYYVTDRFCDPDGATDHLYTEKVFRLPRIFCTYLPPLEFPPVTGVPSEISGRVTFCCFNNFAKTNDELFALWAEILIKVPESRLVLKSTALAEGGTTQQRVIDFFADRMIAPDRLITQVVKKSQYDHLDQYSSADIALDTYPYHGTTTTCEALWMGVPVVTLAGGCHAARVGVSLLSSVGLPDLIARSPGEYVAVAVGLANDVSRRARLRKNMRLTMATSPLMDAAGVTRDVEAAFCRMWNEASAGID